MASMFRKLYTSLPWLLNLGLGLYKFRCLSKGTISIQENTGCFGSSRSTSSNLIMYRVPRSICGGMMSVLALALFTGGFSLAEIPDFVHPFVNAEDEIANCLQVSKGFSAPPAPPKKIQCETELGKDHRCFPPHRGVEIEAIHESLGGGFKDFLCSPRKLGKMNPFSLIFFRWVGSTTNQVKKRRICWWSRQVSTLWNRCFQTNPVRSWPARWFGTDAWKHHRKPGRCVELFFGLWWFSSTFSRSWRRTRLLQDAQHHVRLQLWTPASPSWTPKVRDMCASMPPFQELTRTFSSKNTPSDVGCDPTTHLGCCDSIISCQMAGGFWCFEKFGTLFHWAWLSHCCTCTSWWYCKRFSFWV